MSNAQWRLFGAERRQTSLVLVFKRGGGSRRRWQDASHPAAAKAGWVGFDSRKKAVVVD